MSVQFTARRGSNPIRFPNAIRTYRLKAGLSQRELGARLGRSRAMVSIWERGRGCPSVPNLLRLAKTLNTLAEALYIDLYAPKPTDSSPKTHVPDSPVRA